MPRKSLAALMVASPRVDGFRTRIPPPVGLSASAREVWLEVVQDVPAEHFRKSDSALLASFCEACALASLAANEIRDSGPVVNGKVSPWLAVLEKCHRSQAVLAVRLRLCPSSRLDPKS